MNHLTGKIFCSGYSYFLMFCSCVELTAMRLSAFVRFLTVSVCKVLHQKLVSCSLFVNTCLYNFKLRHADPAERGFLGGLELLRLTGLEGNLL